MTAEHFTRGGRVMLRFDRRCGLAVWALVTTAVVTAALVLGVVAPRAVHAEEGMWLVQALDKAKVKEWQKKGLEVDAKGIYNPKKPAVCDAVVKVGGGTGTFVSANGLILTNHHVAFGALQRSSSVNSDYINVGFLAETYADEILALGYDGYVLEDAKDVTKKVLGAADDNMTDKERYDAIEAVSKEIVAETEKGKDIFAEVKSTYDGSQYYLNTYFKIKDVRIVYAPPAAIGVYGGEIDNWMWPRHTGDFSFLRAYVGPDGNSAEYAEDNVPYQPKKHLAFSTAPLKEDDLTMVIGYPGATRRYRSSFSIDYAVNTYYPDRIRRFEDLIAMLEEESAKDRDSAIKLASTIRSLENSYKNSQGMLEGLLKYDLLAKKLAEEQTLKDYMASHAELEEKYGHVLEAIGTHYVDYLAFEKQYNNLRYMTYVCKGTAAAQKLYKWSIEQEKEDMDRDPGYMTRDEPTVKRALELADLRYDEDADKRLLVYFITELAGLPGDQRPAAVAAICGDLEGEALDKAIVSAVDRLYAGTQVPDKETRMKMFGMSKEELLKLDDPLINFAAEIEPARQELEDSREATPTAHGAAHGL
jgi:hypothetical protein